MKTIRLKKGLTLRLAGAPQQRIFTGPAIDHVAWQAPPNSVLQPDRLVKVGQRVRCGDALFIDRHAPDVLHVAPASGTVESIVRSENQSLSAIEICCNDCDGRSFEHHDRPYASSLVRSQLQLSGLWTFLRERPFETVPAPDSSPQAIFVTALDTRPLAPDPAVLIADDEQAFELGLEALAALTPGIVYLCQAPDSNLPTGFSERVHSVVFQGPHPAGLAGIHMQKLSRPSRSHRVWHIDSQEVIAIGVLLRDGRLTTERVVALAGDQVVNPRLVRTRQFAAVHELLRDQLYQQPAPGRPLLGSVLSGRHARWLDRFDRQVSVFQAAALSKQTGRAPDFRGFVAEPRFDSVNAHDVLPVPLLRALLSADLERAEALGCMELAAEDLDVLSYICPAGNDYGAALARCQALLSSAPA